MNKTSENTIITEYNQHVQNSGYIFVDATSGMLIEFLINLLDDSGGGGGDMWKGRAIAFIASLTRVLVYLRDTGFIQLSPKVFTQYMELEALEELVYNHHGKYGSDFERVAEQLQAYLVSLSGSREQHGYITMQFTKALMEQPILN